MGCGLCRQPHQREAQVAGTMEAGWRTLRHLATIPVPVVRLDSRRSVPVPLRIAFARNQIEILSPEDYLGETYLQAFEETLRTLAR